MRTVATGHVSSECDGTVVCCPIPMSSVSAGVNSIQTVVTNNAPKAYITLNALALTPPEPSTGEMEEDGG